MRRSISSTGSSQRSIFRRPRSHLLRPEESLLGGGDESDDEGLETIHMALSKLPQCYHEHKDDKTPLLSSNKTSNTVLSRQNSSDTEIEAESEVEAETAEDTTHEQDQVAVSIESV